MKRKKLKMILSWFLVIIWMIIIFWFSAMPSEQSNSESKNTIHKVISQTLNTTNKIGLTNQNISDNKIDEIATSLNKPLRKCMHASVYFVLTLLLMHAFYIKNFSLKQMIFFSMIFCILYACSDELHQLFVSGRTAQIVDVFIDTIGGFFGMMFYCLLYKMIKYRKTKE